MFTLLFITHQCSAASSSFGFSTISTSVTSMTSGAESASSFFFAFLSVFTCLLSLFRGLFHLLSFGSLLSFPLSEFKSFIFLGSQNSNWQNSF